eukprot:Skav201255  [mRNA]  locus=scaffold1492:128189:130215:- [translate_table: standard]
MRGGARGQHVHQRAARSTVARANALSTQGRFAVRDLGRQLVEVRVLLPCGFYGHLRELRRIDQIVQAHAQTLRVGSLVT